jgi:hypothetical protein
MNVMSHDAARNTGMCVPVDYFIKARFWILYTCLSVTFFCICKCVAGNLIVRRFATLRVIWRPIDAMCIPGS